MLISEAIESGWKRTEDGRYRFSYIAQSTGHRSSRFAMVVNCCICDIKMLQDQTSVNIGRSPVCSTVCRSKWTSTQRPARLKKDRILRHGYWFVRDSNNTSHLKGWIPEHIKVFREAHGREPDNSAIHHLNGNKLDNRVENLVCLPRSNHLQLHNMISRTLNVLFYDLLAEETYRHIISIGEGIS